MYLEKPTDQEASEHFRGLHIESMEMGSEDMVDWYDVWCASLSWTRNNIVHPKMHGMNARWGRQRILEFTVDDLSSQRALS